MANSVREQVLQLVREERERQVEIHGTNDDLEMGFGGAYSLPWLAPYSFNDASVIEQVFRRDYELHERGHGKPTWMHLIREEVAELFESSCTEHTIAEAVQVAALCVSLVEHLRAQPKTLLSPANMALVNTAFNTGDSRIELRPDASEPWVVGRCDGMVFWVLENAGVLYSVVPASGGGLVSVFVGSELLDPQEGVMFPSVDRAREFVEERLAK